MALVLSFSIEERNDNKLITVTDTAGTYHVVDNPTGWGAPNPDVTGIDGVTHTLELNITVTTSDGTATTYDAIDLFTEFGPFAVTSDLVFELDMTMLKVIGVSAGTTDDEFPDGIYEIEYVYDDGLGSERSVNYDILVDGVVRVAVYDLLREIPTIYNCNECKSKTVLDAIYCYGCLNVMRSDAYAAKKEELINLLYTLERLVINGSNYTW